LQVVDSKGGILSKKEHAEKGRFTFTTDEYEVYEICFISKVPHGKASDFRDIECINELIGSE
jgi:hypothetical protein